MMKDVINQIHDAETYSEWVLYDGQCPICLKFAHRYRKILNRLDLGLVPLQEKAVAQSISHLDDPMKEMLVLTKEKTLIGGADAFVYISKKVWWGYPFYLFAQIPGVIQLLRWGYRRFATNRYCFGGQCQMPRR
jgi:predicted DCC family thiol-disulfide oxidoreductase YuxK